MSWRPTNCARSPVPDSRLVAVPPRRWDGNRDRREVIALYVGVVELDVLLGDVRSLKQKRSVVRPVIAELRRRFDVSVAEAGHLDLHRRTLIGVAVVASEASHVRELTQACERLVAGRPELELLSARHRVLGPEDE